MAMQRTRHIAVWLRMLAIKEIRMGRDVARVLKKQAREIAASYKKGGHADAEMVAIEHANDWFKLIVANYAVTIRDFAKYVEDSLKAKSKKATFTDLTMSYIEREALKKAKQLTQTTKDIITRTIRDGEELGLGVEAIASNIVDSVGGTLSQSRAATIARTETHTAAGYGMQAQARDIGFPVKKIWVAVEDDRTREAHTFVDGTELAIDDYFEVGNSHMQFPGDPNGEIEDVINCRCTLIYEPTTSI